LANGDLFLKDGDENLATGTESSGRLDRLTVPSLDEMLGVPFHVLDDGFVRVVDYMGNDAAIVQAARVSYGTGTKTVHNDSGLIRYLMRHSHTTPFEMCEIKLHVRVPMDTWRQWIRHRTASVNEYSTRYSIAIDAAEKTKPSGWRTQDSSNKQGSEGALPVELGARLSEAESHLHKLVKDNYDERIALGVAREQARKDLPLSTYTEAFWKTNLHNLFHFLRLRMDEHAQKEIRSYAAIIGEKIVAAWVPLAWSAFRDYQLESVAFSNIEVEIVKALQRSPKDAISVAEKYGLLKQKDGQLVPNRERREIESKFAQLGIEVPWSK